MDTIIPEETQTVFEIYRERRKMISKKNPYQKKGAELRKDKRMQIQGRVNIIKLALCADFIEKKGVRISNRSDLLDWIVSVAWEVADMSSEVELVDINTVHEAFRFLETKGIRWEGKRARKVKRRLMEEEDSLMEGFSTRTNAYEGKDIVDKETMDMAEELYRQKRDKDDWRGEKEKKARPGTGSGIAEGIPDGAPIVRPDDQDEGEEDDG